MGHKAKKEVKTAQSKNIASTLTGQSKSLAPPENDINFTVQRKENKTGLPDNLKSGIEHLSGIDVSDVKVYYNSLQPAQLNAHAYAQGNQIHVASGQEKHLPHEAWHVVQQKQGRVKPTAQLKGKTKTSSDQEDFSNSETQSNDVAVAQRIVIHGADADESSGNSQLGFSRLISASEIQNTNSYLKNEKRQGVGVFSIEDLEKMDEPFDYDPVNYINGHYQASAGTYLGKTCPEMASFFKVTGLKSGEKLILLGCESALYAQGLAVELHRLGINTTVTGAHGIAFDYHDAGKQSVVEAMYDKRHTPLDDALKRDVVTKYEERFINEVINDIVDGCSDEEQQVFMTVFTKIGASNLSHLSKSTLTLAQEPKVVAAQAMFQQKIGPAPVTPATLQFPMTADALIQISEQKPFPPYCKADLIALKNQASAFLPKKSERAADLRGLRNQVLTGIFKLKVYTSNDQLWISDFMKGVNALSGDFTEGVKAIIMHKYVELGRAAANEYIARMTAANDQIPQAIIPKGWITFDEAGGLINAHSTYREVADS
jgi:hypothetical protein